MKALEMPALEESPTMLRVEKYCKFYVCNNIFPENSFYLSIVYCLLSTVTKITVNSLYYKTELRQNQNSNKAKITNKSLYYFVSAE